MKLALVYPPFRHKAFNENLVTVDDEFGVFPYISYGYVAGEARAAGWDARLFDAAADESGYPETLAAVEAYGPDLLAFPAHAVQTFRDMLAWAERFKRDTGLPILVGGYETEHYPREIMAHVCFDYMCRGGAVPFLGEFLGAFGRSDGYGAVPGLVHREGGELRWNPRAEEVPFDRLPIPTRDIFDNTLYRSHVSQRSSFTVGMSSVGCPFGCDFCCMRKTGFVARSARQVFDEMAGCVARHDIHEIDWFDPVMLQDKRRIEELADRLIEARLDVIWSTRTRVEPLLSSRRGGRPDEAFIAKLAASGCRRLFVGIESANAAILTGIHKSLDVTPVHDVCGALRDHGIMVLGFFMIGSPGETRATARETIAFARSLPLDYAQFSMTTMKPHTALAEQHMERAMGMDYWREYMLGNVEERPLPTPWTELGRDEIERLARRGYLEFYFRPGYVLDMLRKVESMEELARYVRVALRMALPRGKATARSRARRRPA
jgi:anaerobic magnesium-protoporphyrin IX monomethyl ester cyclase